MDNGRKHTSRSSVIPEEPESLLTKDFKDTGYKIEKILLQYVLKIKF